MSNKQLFLSLSCALIFTLSGCVAKHTCKNTCAGKQYKSTFYFETAKADLDLETKEEIKQLAQNMGCEGFRVRLEGHADISGETNNNERLGEKRNKAVKDFILSLGIPEDKIDVISYGQTQPAEEGYTPQAYSKNRRVEVIFIYDGGKEYSYSSPEDIYEYYDKVQDSFDNPKTAIRAQQLIDAAQKAKLKQSAKEVKK